MTNQFELEIYLPDTLQGKINFYDRKIESIHYFKVPQRMDLDRNLLAFLITSHLRWPSFRRRFKYEFFNQVKLSSVSRSLLGFLRSINRNRTLIWMYINKLHRASIEMKTKKALMKFRFQINPCDLIIVVSNTSDVVNEIALQAANDCNYPLIQIVENWDNLSSKLCPSKNAKKLIVWGQQTKKFAINIHGVKSETVVVLGSSRLPNRRKIENLKTIQNRSKFQNDTIRVFYPGYGGENEDEKYLSRLQYEISREFPHLNVLIIFRPHPLTIKAKGKDFFSNLPSYIELDFPEIEYEKGSDWPKLNDSIYTTMLQSDLVIGTPSTFLLEAMLFNLPIVLDLRRTLPKFHSHRDRFLTATHFEEILNDSRIIRFMHESEIGEASRRALIGVEDYSDLTNYLIYNDDTDFANRLVSFLNNDFFRD